MASTERNAIDCDALEATATALTWSQGTIDGPFVDPALTKPFYGPEWSRQPTQAMIAQAAAGTDSIIDMCVFEGGRVKQCK